MTQALGTAVLATDTLSSRPAAAGSSRRRAPPLALIATDPAPVGAPAPAEAREQRRARREAGGLLLLAVAVHAALGLAWRQRSHDAPLPPRQQVVELVRPAVVPPPPVPEPPPPPSPPPRRLQAPPPPATPALRTPAAEPTEVAPQTITIPENTTAAPSTGPVVAAPPAPPPAPKVEEPIVEAHANAAYLKNPPPAYPTAAQRRGLQGTVLLRVHVLPDGHADSVEVRQSSGARALDEAALEAVRHWTFVPAMRGKTALAGWATVPIEFKLSD